MPASKPQYDAVVIGSGPNGLAAAITIAQAGHSVVVFERHETIGGGTRSAELTLPGFLHDVCSAVHPFGIGSPFFRTLPLAEHGLVWIQPSAPLAHPLDDGTAAVVERSVAETAKGLGQDGHAYAHLFGPLVKDWPKLESLLTGPLSIPSHPFAVARFGLHALRPASSLARSLFHGPQARALFAGFAAHSILPLDSLPTAAFALMFGITAHAVGWPFAQGGSQKIADALAAHLNSLGGEILTGKMIESLDQLPPSHAVLCDVTPRQLLRIAGAELPASFRKRLDRFRYGPGVCKVDYALDAPIPWKSRDCARAGTVHLGGSLEEIEASERAAWRGEHAERPFILLAQPTLFDPSRAPAGKHIAWAYCHVPNGSAFDMSPHIDSQIERFAPGFRGRILARHVTRASEMEAQNPNLIGGDVAAGASTLRQFLFRPTRRLYRTPRRGLYLCSASTPPGAGVHGLCGHLAARAALADIFR
jgi:phytoene dehydrogenase-like protein